jgi:O-antigen/teichoic acid export membrane protein
VSEIEPAPSSEPSPSEASRASAGGTSALDWLTGQIISAWQSFRRLLSVVRLRPFDAATAEGRSSERYRRAALTSLSSMLARGIGVFTGLAWIRISLGYLGKEAYGLWMAVGSLIAWANLADLGLARGMQNHLSRANGEDDRELGARYVSTGFLALLTMAAVLGLLALPALFLVNWNALLNVRDTALVQQTRSVLFAVLACFLLSFPLSVVSTIYSAYQRGYVPNLFSLLNSLVSLLMLLIVTQARLSLPWLIVATNGVGVATTLVNFGVLLREMPWLRPRLSLISRATLRDLAATSGSLFLFQIGALMVNETQSVIIARKLGLAHVTEWSIFMRVLLLPLALIQMIDLPLIPAFREAHVRGEADWLRTAFWRVTKLKMAIAVICAGLLIGAGNWIAGILSGGSVSLPREVWGACALLLVVAAWGGSFNDLMIAVDRLRLLVITVIANGIVTPVLTYALAVHLGLFGVALALPLFSIVSSAWLLPWACRDLLRSAPQPAARVG